jgi:hypothetical protein
MTFSDDRLMAYVDRELDPASTAEIDAAIARDPELAARVERQRKLRVAVHAAFEPILQEPMPKRLLDAASGTAPVSSGSRASRRWTWFEWSAMAASVVLGVLIGGALIGDLRRAPAIDPSTNLAAERGHVVARGRLALALSEQLASTQKPDASVRIGLTFLSKGGEYCRTFTLEKGAAAGLACSSAGEWRIPLIVQADRTGPSGDYRTAAAQLPPAVLRAVDERIQGSSLDAEAERAAQQRGWKR